VGFPGLTTVSLVSGGNRGIGREVCRQLSTRGHTVLLTARSASAAETAARDIGAEPLRLDVTDAGSIAAAARYVGDRHGKLDVLVNNAAISYDTWQRAASADLAVVREAMETNLYGPWLLVQQFLPWLRASDHPRIVNVSSEAGSLASMGGGTPAYAVSKAGLNALTRMLADDLRGDRILVNSVCPGWVATDMGGPGGGPWPTVRPAWCGPRHCPITARRAGSSATAGQCPGKRRRGASPPCGDDPGARR
jgi:NAD(P)-dependent dehydrogenase (short-subunit alcohol dehydrogenase family)